MNILENRRKKRTGFEIPKDPKAILAAIGAVVLANTAELPTVAHAQTTQVVSGTQAAIESSPEYLKKIKLIEQLEELDTENPNPQNRDMSKSDTFWIDALDKGVLKIPRVQGEYSKEEILNILVNINPEKASVFLEKNHSKDPEYVKLIQTSLINYVKTEVTVDESRKEKIATYSMLIRLINNSHWDNDFRKKVVEMLSVQQLVFLMPSLKDEIYTSTSTFTEFIMPKLFREIESKKGLKNFWDSLSIEESDKKDFIFIVARYGFMGELFKKGLLDQETLKDLTASFLEIGFKNNEAVAVLEVVVENTLKAIGKNSQLQSFAESVQDMLITNLLKQQELLKRTDLTAEERKIILYKQKAVRVIMSLVADFAVGDGVNFFKNIKAEEKLEPANHLSNEKVFTDGVHRQVWFFMEGGDGDGVGSLEDSVRELQKKERDFRAVETGPDFVRFQKKINDKGKIRTVEIILSKPIKREHPEISKKFSDLIKSNPVHNISYRGHSTYVDEFVTMLTPIFQEKSKSPDPKVSTDPVLFWAGSCGGVGNLEAFMSIFSNPPKFYDATDKVGSSSVNSPKMADSAKFILEKGYYDSEEFSKWQIDTGAPYTKLPVYISYVPPHQNTTAMIVYTMNGFTREQKM